MNVKELMNKLSKCDPKLEVLMATDMEGYCEYFRIDEVEYEMQYDPADDNEVYVIEGELRPGCKACAILWP